MSASDKTEKATPKKLEDARKKGQVARSQDLAGAAVLLAGLFVLPAMAPLILRNIQQAMLVALGHVKDPSIVSAKGIWELSGQIAVPLGLALAPVAIACAIAAVAANLVQVGIKPMPGGLKPDAKKLNPLQGFKNIYGPNAIFEAVKGITKVVLVGAITAAVVVPRLKDMGTLVGMPAGQLLIEVCKLALHVAQYAAAAYVLIALGDFGYQKWRHAKSLRMDKQELKEEMKGQGLPAEVKSQQRRRQAEASRGRMMHDVPLADVVVVNPTHYAVALRYDADTLAPEVVAKGVDHLAARIREVATAHGVPIVPDPPLARALHASVDVGKQIPEELYAAVAQVLAFVYRAAGRARAGAAAA